MKAQQVLVLHGPNLNLLGVREPDVYGLVTLNEINESLAKLAGDLGVSVACFQSNSESELVERVQRARDDHTGFIVVNPAAFTHTSVALRDALTAVGIPFVEVHLSNVYARESFRRHSYFSDVAVGVISGLGARGYLLALQYAADHLASRR